MTDSSGRLRLTYESSPGLLVGGRPEHPLDRDRLLADDLRCTEHDSHAAPPKLLFNPIFAANHFADCRQANALVDLRTADRLAQPGLVLHVAVGGPSLDRVVIVVAHAEPSTNKLT
jgi:hypothetical protein